MADQVEKEAVECNENVSVTTSAVAESKMEGEMTENKKELPGEGMEVDSTTTTVTGADFKKPLFMQLKKNVMEGNVLETAKKQEKLPTRKRQEIVEKPDEESEEKTESETLKEQFTQQAPKEISLPYKEPTWSGHCEEEYFFEVLKTGCIINNLELNDKPFHVFGRLPSCDVTLEHPSLSRYHAVVQYCAIKTDKHDLGWYLYDLDSTHGTWINKYKVVPRIYHRLRVGHVIKFGGSSRLYILQGPSDDREDESELTVTEMKLQREKQLAEVELLKQAELEEEEKRKIKVAEAASAGCSWGMDEEAEEEEVSEVNPFAAGENEEIYIEDPKKALKGYFEREGLELPEYEFEEAGYGKQHCRVELPLDSPTGQPIYAEAVVSGKKKDAVVACALEACRILDRYGELRKAQHESRRRKKRNWEDDDYYDSDEDTFLDRTGTIEVKRQERMKRSGKTEDVAQTYESLVSRLTGIQDEISSLEEHLAEAQRSTVESDDVDDLDMYISSIKAGVLDKKARMKIKSRLFELRQEEQKVRRLANIAKPANMPELKLQTAASKLSPEKKAESSKCAVTGKMKGPSQKGPKKPLPQHPVPEPHVELTDDVEVEEEEEEEKQVTEVMEVAETSKDTQSTESKPAASKESRVKSQRTPSTESADLKKVYGVKLPSKLQEETYQEDDTPITHKRAAQDGEQPKKTSKKKKVITKVTDLSPDDPEFDAVWMPPQGQSGDGKTHLNAKFGY